MSKHTPEPWELLDAEGDKEYLRIRGAVLGGRYKIANVLWPNYSESAREREAAETLANAERIINCVNACAGMVDPAAEIAELKRQRDELIDELSRSETLLACSIEVIRFCREDLDSDESESFIRLWSDADWDTIRDEYPEANAIIYAADPLWSGWNTKGSAS